MEIVTLEIYKKETGEKLGEFTFSRNMEISVTTADNKTKNLVESAIKEIFKDGVETIFHKTEFLETGKEKHVWLKKKIPQDSPLFFEAVMNMLRVLPYGVRFQKTPERTEAEKILRDCLAESLIEEDYKKMVMGRIDILTDVQIKSVTETILGKLKEPEF